MGMGAAPTYLVGLLGPELRESLHLSGAQLGLLVGLFYGATGLTSLLTSRLIDPLGARRCIVIDQFVVAGALVLSVVWNTFPALAVASALAGAAYALANAGTSVAVTTVSRREQAGAAVALKTAGIPLGATVVALAGPPAAAGIGWQGVSLVMAALCAAIAVAGILLLPRAEPRRHAAAIGRQPLPARFFWIPLTGFLFVLGSQPLFSWLVLTLVDAGVSTRGAGLVSATGTALGAVAMVLAARRSDRSGPGRRALVGAAIAATSLAGATVLWLGSHVSLVPVVLGAVVAMLANLTGAGFVHAVTVDRAPQAVGRATSVMSTGYYLGALVSPWAFGAAADLTGSYDASWAATVTAMLACAVCFLVIQRWVRPPSAQTASASSHAAPATRSLR
jgi:predicted MFS family arabinose efflux permease